ncbi:hypothetical protein K435DRAFT_812259 [Dendrothele bispora CBS 962.96]|uniref:Retrotransposon Copia-like N-terminal domain-containing protein n=1 Tax=Dendrothele bispora (strain CBS 962.96) TaxID=1314807 RepID=A0A4S8KPP7_DENBC|nr:hypothetical protein K435DRAFT_812259 [Dendrothele bispora CBS 962.96]
MGDTPTTPNKPKGQQSSTFNGVPSDTTRPSVSAISLNTALFKHDNLSKDAHNWTTWSRQFIQCLRMNQGADAYLTGKVDQPNRFAEPRAYSNWWANNGSILGFMGLTVSESEQEIIDDATTAEEAWTKLKNRHSQEGPVKQVQLIRDALAIRYSTSEKFASTSSKLTTLNKRIWAMGAPSPELFLCILMINSMSGLPELRSTRENVAQALAASDGPDIDLVKEPLKRRYDSTDIKRALDTAQGLVDSESQVDDIALASNHSGPRPRSPQSMVCGTWWRNGWEDN